MSHSTITAQQLHDLVQSGTSIELIDVRTPIEFREVHVSFAKNVPLDQLDAAQFGAGRQGVVQPLYVICRSGSRGKQACDKFVASGYPNIVNVEGGTQAWDAAGLPVVRGKKAMSLERQVRIAAGLLVVTSCLLSILSPYWIGLAGFVGAGLVFAGITDTCGMGLILAKMPWNQVKATGTTTGQGDCTTKPTGSCCG